LLVEVLRTDVSSKGDEISAIDVFLFHAPLSLG